MKPTDNDTHVSDFWRLQYAALDAERHAAAGDAATAYRTNAKMRQAMYVLLTDHYTMTELGIDKDTLRFVFEYLEYFSSRADLPRLLRKVNAHRAEGR